MTDTTLIQRLRQMADGLHDDMSTGAEAADALEQQAAQIEALRADAERLRADLISCRGTVKTEHHHYERLSMVHGKTPHGECYWNEAKRLAELLDRIDSLADAALRQEQPTKHDHFPDAGKMVQPAGEQPT